MSIETKTADSSSDTKEKIDIEELSNGPSSPEDGLENIDEKKLVRKIDFVLIPWLSLLYLVAFLDRTSIGNAKVCNPHRKTNLFQSLTCVCSCTTWKRIFTYQITNICFAYLFSSFPTHSSM